MKQLALFFVLLVLTACSPLAPTVSPHNGHGSDDSQAVPYDALFIDSMIVHHQGAIEMAQEALQKAEHEELRALAEAILSTQQAEIDQMRAWREAWYPGLPATEGLHIHMGDMSVAPDDSRPYDLRFLEAMISHHEGALAMAQDALQKAEHEEIRALAEAIIETQQAEIEQMKEWQILWYGE
jgi:uncharacterized protein (DUF305 family)